MKGIYRIYPAYWLSLSLNPNSNLFNSKNFLKNLDKAGQHGILK